MLLSICEKRNSLEEIAVANRIVDTVRTSLALTGELGQCPAPETWLKPIHLPPPPPNFGGEFGAHMLCLSLNGSGQSVSGTLATASSNTELNHN